jgi:acetyl-CoA acetyltransferase
MSPTPTTCEGAPQEEALLRDVAVVGFAQAPNVRRTSGSSTGVEMLVPVFRQVYEETGLSKGDIDFWCSGSSDYLAGRSFSFVSAVDAIGAFPPIVESHVEMDAAWALYEAWVKVLTGEADVALAYGFGKSSAGTLRRVLSLQTDPYVVAPLWLDAVSMAALQARAGLDSGAWSEREMADVVVRSRAAAKSNPRAQLSGDYTVEDLLDQQPYADPLRRHDCPPVTDGAAAVVLAAGARARELCDRPAWITGFAHRTDGQNLGGRDLTVSPSAAAAGEAAGVNGRGVDVAELYAPFSHQEIVLRRALGLGDDVDVNPSGGPLCANPMFAAGLVRVGEAARRVQDGGAQRVLAHATSGPVLQQNLVCVMERQD